MTVARQLAKFITGLNFEDLPADVIHQTKRIFIDALGYCIGAFDADGSKIVHSMIEDMNGPGMFPALRSIVGGTVLKGHLGAW